MRKAMKGISWLVFLAFIALSSFANWMHGATFHAQIMLAVVPVGFAAAVFLFEGMSAAGKTQLWQTVGVGFVALCAGVASYLGLFGMARDNGIPIVQAALLPLAYDGVVAVASMAIRAFSVVPASVRPPVRRAPVRVPASVPDITEDKPAIESAPVSRTAKWDKDKAAALLAEGRDRADIAETLGISTKTLGRHFPSK